MRLRIVLNGAVAVISLSCAGHQVRTESKPVAIYSMQDVPAELRPLVDEAGGAMGRLAASLVQKLGEELGRGGPVAAIKLCRDEAGEVTSDVSAQTGIEIGRTSHRLRNPSNAPKSWARETVLSAAGRKASEVQPRVFDLGDRIGVLRPIPTQAFCVACHGEAGSLDPAAHRAILDAYPSDQAVGFKEGDLRGWLWTELPKPKNRAAK